MSVQQLNRFGLKEEEIIKTRKMKSFNEELFLNDLAAIK